MRYAILNRLSSDKLWRTNMFARTTLVSPDQNEKVSGPSPTRGLGKLVRYLAVLLLLGVLVGVVYAGFVATHTFTYPSTVAPIINKSYGIGFLANIGPAASLATCGSTPCFSVTGSSLVNVSVSSTLSGGSGVTLTLIQIIPLTQTCTATQPTITSGLLLVPLPGFPAVSITLSGGTDYNYCIYYTSSPSITAGIFSVNYAA